nr:glutathione S-transferase N-terminal domain-containing protein [Halostella sp. PRR32]
MLELYQAEGCGYSATVRETLTELGLSYVVHNPRSGAGETRNEQTRDQLRTLGGDDQIPFLVDHQRGVTMYESDDIVDYLETLHVTDAVTEDCPICASSDSAKEQFATVKVTKHIKRKARRDETHQQWIDTHTTNGTLAEIRDALGEHSGPRR